MAELYFMGNSSESQMFGGIICSGDKTVVIDGGTEADGVQLANMLKDKADGFVDAWFFTHPHHDHIGAFLHVCENNPEIQIDQIYHKFPDIDDLIEYGTRSQNEIDLWKRLFALLNEEMSDRVNVLKKGDIFSFDEMKVNILRVYNSDITSNFINNSSTVYRIDSKDKRVLILGDLGVEGGEEVMKNCSSESLYADYTQLAHHGQWGVTEEFYQYIKPRACLWASPDWLYNNDAGDGFNTGPWETVITRGWMEKLGVKEHYVQKDGTVKIVF